MWRWLADMLHRPGERERNAIQLARLEAEAETEVRRAKRALAERRNLAAATRNTAQALQRRGG